VRLSCVRDFGVRVACEGADVDTETSGDDEGHEEDAGLIVKDSLGMFGLETTQDGIWIFSRRLRGSSV
jgi:hypothetical protein